MSRRERAKDLAIPLILVAADQASKLAALRWLPEDRDVDENALLQLVLEVNSTGMGSALTRSMGGPYPQRALEWSVGFLALTIAILAVRRRKRSIAAKVAVCAAAFAAGVAAGGAADPIVARVPNQMCVVIGRDIAVAFTATIWWLLPRGAWKWTFALFSCAALGNLLSLLYPPFAIVDFLYSRVLHATVGFGTFNLADVCLVAGWVAALVAATIAAGKALVRLVRWLRV